MSEYVYNSINDRVNRIDKFIKREEVLELSTRKRINRIFAFIFRDLVDFVSELRKECSFSNARIGKNLYYYRAPLDRFIGTIIGAISDKIIISNNCWECGLGVSIKLRGGHHDLLSGIYCWDFFENSYKKKLSLKEWERLVDEELQIYFGYNCKNCGFVESMNFEKGIPIWFDGDIMTRRYGILE